MKHKEKSYSYIYLLLFGALLLRSVFAYFYKGFLTDTACFSAWASRIYSVGFADFYSPEVFTDYPPGYMYVLYIIGALQATFQMKYLSGASLLLLKLPAILCDLGAGYLIYRLASKRLTKGVSLALSAAYLFNPAVFINSSMWGQVDAVFTLTLLLMCMLLTEGKTIPAYYVFALGGLLKPQTLVFTPLLLYGIY